MEKTTEQHSQAWVAFTYLSFLGSIAMVSIGIYFMPADISTKGFLAMGLAMLIQSSFTLSKTIRDNHESQRLMNRLEDARTERILAGVERG